MSQDSPASDRPLCVDLDGTLILTDVLFEGILHILHKNPLYVFLFPVWLLKGKAGFKAEIAKRVPLDPAALPYNIPFMDWLLQRKKEGAKLWLCTGANVLQAESVAQHLGIFEGVIASSSEKNCAGKEKAEALSAKFGLRNFDYCGNEAKDLAVWQESQSAIVVNADRSLEQRAEKVAQVSAFFPAPPVKAATVLAAMRPLQWGKNLLVFVPLVTAHDIKHISTDLVALVAFLSFSLCASSVYLLNDMMDLDADRHHPAKSARPLASGQLPLTYGATLAPVLFAAALAMAVFLPAHFVLLLAGYYMLSTLYSFMLKRIPLLDTLCLATLYTLRIIAGAAAVNVKLSFWLLLFSVFFFLSLALVKRCTELDILRRAGKGIMHGRSYQPDDLLMLQVFGVVAGYLSVLVLALYINSPEVVILYSRPWMIWGLCPIVLYWISRIWLKAHRGQMPDDPVIFALNDKTSYVAGACTALIMLLAT